MRRIFIVFGAVLGCVVFAHAPAFAHTPAFAPAPAVAGGAAVTGAQTPPAIAMEPSSAATGQEVVIRGRSWPPGSQVHLEVCGNQGMRGTPDCDQASSVIAAAGGDGAFGAAMRLAAPPVPCPCVLRAAGIDTTLTVSLPINLLDLPSASPAAVPAPITELTRQLVVADAQLTGTSGWGVLFGAAPRRTLVLTVANTGDVAITDPDVVIAAGKGPNPTGIVDAPDVGILQPGESMQLEVPVRFDPPAFGSYVVQGEIVGFSTPATFRVTTSAHAWGLVVIGLVLLQAALLLVRNRVRRRLWARRPAVEAERVDPPSSSPVDRPTPALEPVDLASPPEDGPTLQELDAEERDQFASELASAVVGALRSTTDQTASGEAPTGDLGVPSDGADGSPSSDQTDMSEERDGPMDPDEPEHLQHALATEVGWVAAPPALGVNHLVESIHDLAESLVDATSQQASMLDAVRASADAAASAAKAEVDQRSVAATQRATRAYIEAQQVLDEARAAADRMLGAAHEQACQIVAAAEADANHLIEAALRGLQESSSTAPSVPIIDLTGPGSQIELHAITEEQPTDH